jgi:D-inositol-3-phosphate glycosyltransferase
MSPQAIRGAGVAVESICRVLVQLDMPKTVVVPHQYIMMTEEWLNRIDCRANVQALEGLLLNPGKLPPGLWFDPAAFTSFALRLRNIACNNPSTSPLLTVQHTLSLPQLLRGHFDSMLQEPVSPFDTIICGSVAAKEAVEKLFEYLQETCSGTMYKGRTLVMPLPIDTEFYCPGNRVAARRRLRLPLDHFACLYVGQVSPLKADWAPLLNVMSEVFKKCSKPTTLILAGMVEPTYRSAIQTLKERFPFVRVLGRVSSQEKLFLYQAADIFVSPADALTESFGLTPLEAMSCGLPQLVSDWNGYRDVVVHGVTGFRVKTLWEDLSNLSAAWGITNDTVSSLEVSQQIVIDVDEWAKYLSLLMQEKDLLEQMRSASRAHAIAHFSHSSTRERYDVLIRSALAEAEASKLSASYSIPNTTRYFRCFGHYATSNTILSASVTLRRPECLKPAYDSLHQEAKILVRPAVAEKIVAYLSSCYGGEVEHVADLINVLVASHSFTASEVYWHCCWLAKQGVLRLL